ncbi:MAG: 2-oxoacid:ferredoxin oxidoreductase subunit gamma [Methanobacteriota archaeon]|nr:MAG: 2-oxoacid:ferredoxin oxidoreductase subunit gamma [Euryarchaeota archaeon]
MSPAGVERLRISGVGGQGVQLLGEIIAITGMHEGKHVSYLPSYGPESRGGTSNCHVVLSTRKVGSPLVDEPDVLIPMNRPSIDRFEEILKPGGLMIYNASLINREPRRDDIVSVAVPMNELAAKAGEEKAANMVALGSYISITESIKKETLFEKTFPEQFAGAKKKFIPLNTRAVEAGIDYVNQHYPTTNYTKKF